MMGFKDFLHAPKIRFTYKSNACDREEADEKNLKHFC
jgi:hypothetical protein